MGRVVKRLGGRLFVLLSSSGDNIISATIFNSLCRSLDLCTKPVDVFVVTHVGNTCIVNLILIPVIWPLGSYFLFRFDKTYFHNYLPYLRFTGANRITSERVLAYLFRSASPLCRKTIEMAGMGCVFSTARPRSRRVSTM